MSNTPALRAVAWELTRGCPLKCRHCRAEAVDEAPEGELSTEECKAFLDDLASMGPCLVILTGGEPMLREDVYEIARYATDKGFRVVAAPCGLYLTVETARELMAAGVKRVSLSVDGATAESHDKMRGVDGAFDMVTKAMAAAREAGLSFQINTTVHAGNLAELPTLLKFVQGQGAAGWDVFLLVPTGRGKKMAGQELSAPEYEETLLWVREQAVKGEIPIKLTCAPQYVRIAEEKGLQGTPCLGGKSFAFLGHKGDVQICGFLDVVAGNIREKPFSRLWQEARLFQDLRLPENYKGKCARCEYVSRCGGCRARAYALTGDYLNAEPYCVYRPAAKDKA